MERELLLLERSLLVDSLVDEALLSGREVHMVEVVDLGRSGDSESDLSRQAEAGLFVYTAMITSLDAERPLLTLLFSEREALLLIERDLGLRSSGPLLRLLALCSAAFSS